jgi:hypothetical protein
MWGAHWSILLEKRGIPGVYIVDEPFIADVQVTCEKEGMPELRRVNIPHPAGNVSDEELPEILTEMVNALTKPVTEGDRDDRLKKEKASHFLPMFQKAEDGPPIEKTEEDRGIGKAPTQVAIIGTLEEVQKYFDDNCWTDGLPIVPPTRERIEEMLSGTSHPPGEIVTKTMLPEDWIVTVEKVAIVGVMAGCKPADMPVLLAIIEAFSQEVFASTVRSTTSFSFPIIVSGPIAKEIGMNSGINALGSGTGNKANATIGRFLRLALINLGGSKSGVSDMSSQGSPSKYGFAFAENEERSPWEPFHVSMGCRPDESVVTIMSGGWSHMGCFGNVDLDEMAKAVTSIELPNGLLLIMDPMSAGILAKRGYKKKDVEEYIWAHAKTTAGEFRSDFFYPAFIEPILKGTSMYGRDREWPSHYLNLRDDELVHKFPEGSIKVVVVGGETNPFTQAWRMSRPIMVSADKWRQPDPSGQESHFSNRSTPVY